MHEFSSRVNKVNKAVARVRLIRDRLPLIETSKFKAISDSKERKFSHLVNEKEHGRKSCPETSRANSRLVQAKSISNRSYVLKTKEER